MYNIARNGGRGKELKDIKDIKDIKILRYLLSISIGYYRDPIHGRLCIDNLC